MIPVAPGFTYHRLLSRRVIKGVHRGFTLLELLIAVSIFAVMAAVAYGGLRTVLESKRVLDGKLQALIQLQGAFTMLRRDIEQAATRGVRDETGMMMPPLAGGDGESEVLVLTRAGWSNPLEMKRSTLQRVSYRWHDHALHRVSWRVLDRVDEGEPTDARLLDGIEAVDLRFLDQHQKWHTAWPPEEQTNPGLPRAVEVAFKLQGRGELSRLFCLPVAGEMEQREAS